MSLAPEEISSTYEEVLPGVYSGVPNEKYHSTDGYSHSNLVNVEKSISTYKWSKTHQKTTDAMIMGSAFHDLVLLPDEYKNTYIVSPVKGKNTKKYQQMVLDNPDKVILTPGVADTIHYMRDSMFNNPSMREHLEAKTNLREVSIWARCPHTNLLRKIRPDMIHDGFIIDLKSSIAPTPWGFKHSIYEYKYFIQSPYYIDTAKLIDLNIKDFLFFVVGKTPPYLTGIYNINEELMEEGRQRYLNALNRMAEYLITEEWDGLENGREVVTL